MILESLRRVSFTFAVNARQLIERDVATVSDPSETVAFSFQKISDEFVAAYSSS